MPAMPFERVPLKTLLRMPGTNPPAPLAVGVASISQDGTTYSEAFGRTSPEDYSQKAINPDRMMRVASISKMVTAALTHALAQSGILDLTTSVAEYLPLRDKRRWPSLIECLTHTSGLGDSAGYIIEPPQRLSDFLNHNADQLTSDRQTASKFQYANLNYVILGAIAEIVTEMRLDRLAQMHVLAPAGVNGGFNWVGVSSKDRSNRLPLFQNRHGTMHQTVDGRDGNWEAPLIWKDGVGFDFETYELGEHTGLFSPHGGLRTNLVGIAKLAHFVGRQAISQPDHGITHCHASPEDDIQSCDGLFQNVGPGYFMHRRDPRIPGKIIGHAGHALGFAGGAWFNAKTRTAFAYFLNGMSDGTKQDGTEQFYSETEREILRHLLR